MRQKRTEGFEVGDKVRLTEEGGGYWPGFEGVVIKTEKWIYIRHTKMSDGCPWPEKTHGIGCISGWDNSSMELIRPKSPPQCEDWS